MSRRPSQPTAAEKRTVEPCQVVAGAGVTAGATATASGKQATKTLAIDERRLDESVSLATSEGY